MRESVPQISTAFAGMLGSFSLDVAFKMPMRGLTALFGSPVILRADRAKLAS